METWSAQGKYDLRSSARVRLDIERIYRGRGEEEVKLAGVGTVFIHVGDI